MSNQTELAANVSVNRKKWIIGGIVFLIVAAVGLFWAKWNPYFHKAFTAAASHSIGSSVVSGTNAAAPDPSWSAAWDFSIGYFKSIWHAFIVGIVLASLVQVLLPKNWIQRVLGKTSYGSTLVAGVAALPGMM